MTNHCSSIVTSGKIQNMFFQLNLESSFSSFIIEIAGKLFRTFSMIDVSRSGGVIRVQSQPGRRHRLQRRTYLTRGVHHCVKRLRCSIFRVGRRELVTEISLCHFHIQRMPTRPDLRLLPGQVRHSHVCARLKVKNECECFNKYLCTLGIVYTSIAIFAHADGSGPKIFSQATSASSSRIFIAN